MFLKIADYAASLLIGTGTLFLVSLIVGEGWNVILAMLAGMIAGLVVLLIVMVPFIPISTFFELFPGGMIIGMFTGMTTGMFESMGKENFRVMLIVVIVFSIFVQRWFDFYNMKMKGDVPVGS